MANTKIAINWFEIPVGNLDRASKFYSVVFETELVPMETPGGKIMAFQNGETPVGALSPCDGNAPSSNGAMLYFDADGDIDGTLKRVEAAGGKVIVPNTAIGPYGYMAHFADTEGNRVALHSA